MTGKGKHFEIKYIFVNYECHILCSDNENININIFSLTGLQTDSDLRTLILTLYNGIYHELCALTQLL